MYEILGEQTAWICSFEKDKEVSAIRNGGKNGKRSAQERKELEDSAVELEGHVAPMPENLDDEFFLERKMFGFSVARWSDYLENASLVMVKLANADKLVLLLSVISKKHPHYAELVKLVVDEALIQDEEFFDEDVDGSDSTKSVDSMW